MIISECECVVLCIQHDDNVHFSGMRTFCLVQYLIFQLVTLNIKCGTYQTTRSDRPLAKYILQLQQYGSINCWLGSLRRLFNLLPFAQCRTNWFFLTRRRQLTIACCDKTQSDQESDKKLDSYISCKCPRPG